ncbi:YozQ family protein [Thermaerobacillus caldiproteolyticus]|uniref:DUF4025 domain-containing protein n=1 Tax=Thermaerobacillus caldiproteolyticus TaxID=247480 RepID=A0A7W0BZ35_9BACL|nr:YozQ family protein [Anoxybacillus caldiproteolyticus]MBA2875200.1 hypothetical protein [Anoxybacillus caldiproteolyticus]QPA32857.1 YozQ family protein [Anoxybacillus caldiproteolyticus]
MTTQDSVKIAGRQYKPSDYECSSSLSSALATTHEQVSDVYTEGTIEAVVDDVNGKDIPIPVKENE